MTSSEKPTRLLIPQPFASATGAAYTEILQSADSNNVNFAQGFPSAFAVPASAGGKYVTRGNMNAIGRLASQNDFCRACGNIFTFDPDFAIAIGGYPKGAVLEYINGTDYFKVVSLVDNNMYDFTGTTPTAAQAAAGIVASSVGSSYWAYMNRETSSNIQNIIAELINARSEMRVYGDAEGLYFPFEQCIGSGFFPVSGVIRTYGTVTTNITNSKTDSSSGRETFQSSVFVVIKYTSPNSSGYKYKLLFRNSNLKDNGVSTDPIYITTKKGNVDIVDVHAGYHYDIYQIMSNVTTSNSSLKFYIQEQEYDDSSD